MLVLKLSISMWRVKANLYYMYLIEQCKHCCMQIAANLNRFRYGY